MTERIADDLQKKVFQRLSFYRDLGIYCFYRDRGTRSPAAIFAENAPVALKPSREPEDTALTTPATRAQSAPVSRSVQPDKPSAPRIDLFVAAPSASLFESAGKPAAETMPLIRADLGECTRCKLHTGRTKLVFGDGNPKAELVFVGEGPGRDEDLQGFPFVGRAGKLLTQMIEAMGLQRKDVYICNVVKCRPPENRAPEKDEVAECSPFLLRQLDAISPKVIVCLGSTAFQALLQTNRGISSCRGQWLDFHRRKLLATYHPAYLLRNPAAKADVWQDLQKVMAVLGLKVKKSKPS